MIEIIALLSMIIDHIGIIFFPKMIIFQIIGRLSFPAYAFLISLGYSRTKNSLLYFFRILLLGIVSQVLYYYLISPIKLNVCFTLAFGLLFLMVIYSQKLNKYLKALFCLFIVSFSFFSGCEYGIYGILLIYLFHLYIKNRQNIKRNFILIVGFILITILSIIVFNFPKIYIFSLCVLPIIILVPENKQKTKCIKYFNYTFYPLHLLILLLVNALT